MDKMRNIITESFLGKSSFRIASTSLIMIIALSTIDHATGFDLSFSIFYLVPVVFASWYGTPITGAFVFFLSAVAWMIVDLAAGNNYSSTVYPYWNACIRLGFFFVIYRLITTIKIKIDTERKSARLDRLTGTMNTHFFGEASETVFQLAKRNEKPVAMGYLDIDNFKQVNSTHGHPAGDRVLAAVASILMKSVRYTDFVGRPGGDEFAILMPDTKPSDALTMFNNLHQKLIAEMSAQGWQIECSIGVAAFKTAPETVAEAIRLAEELMYEVKSQGKNAVLIKMFGDTDPADAKDGSGEDSPAQ
jgi:diguanylate cyclase (GGDEF)-like protein